MAAIQNHYSINIAHHGKHFCTVDSCITPHDLQRVLPVVVEKFQEADGYSVGVSAIKCHGEGLSRAALKTFGLEPVGQYHDVKRIKK